MNEYLSKKFRFISFISIIGVVLIHSYNYRFFIPKKIIIKLLTSVTVIPAKYGLEHTSIIASKIGLFFQFSISNGFARFAVPMFFLTSGYFFFRKFSKSYKLNNYITQIKKRIKSLVIPYILWTIIAGIIVYVFSLTLLPSIGDVFIYFYNHIGKWIISSPAYQLWFIGDLMKLTIISPIIYFLVKKFKKKFLFIIFIVWLLNITLTGPTILKFVFNHLNIEVSSIIYSLLRLSIDGIFFFSLGTYLAIFNKEDLMLRKNKKVMWITLSLWVILTVIYSILAISQTANALVLLFLYKTIQILGILSIWTFYDYFITNWDKNKFIKLAVASTFLIYVSHVPLLGILKRLYFKILGHGSLTHLTAYIILPILMILMGMVLHIVLKKYSKTTYNILTGNR